MAEITTESKTFIPTLSWGQNPDYLFITIEWVSQKPVIDLTPTEFHFNGEKEGKTYVMKFELFNEIDVEESKIKITERCVRIMLKKKDYEKWIRITKDKNLYKQNIRVNWNDYDSEEEEAETKSIPMDFQNMMNNPNFDFQKMISSMNQNMTTNGDEMNQTFGDEEQDDEEQEDNEEQEDDEHRHDHSHEHDHNHSCCGQEHSHQ